MCRMLGAAGQVCFSSTLAALLLFLPVAARGSSPVVPELPVEAFFRGEDLKKAQLSPNGDFVAAITRGGEKSLLVVVNLETRAKNVVMGGEIYDFRWVSNERLVFESGGVGLGGLFSVNRDGSKPQVLQPPLGYQPLGRGLRLHYLEVLAVPEDSPDCILVEKAEFNPDPFARQELPRPAVYRVNFINGHRWLDEQNPGNVVSFVADARGVVRGAVAVDGEKLTLLYRREKAQAWKVIHEEHIMQGGAYLSGFASEQAQALLSALGGKDTLGLYLFDPETRRLGTCLWQDDTYDVDEPIIGKDGLQGVKYDAERPEVVWFMEPYKTYQRLADKTFPGGVNQLANYSAAARKYLYLSTSDRFPGAYYVFDASSNTFSMIGKVRGLIDPNLMAEMKPISYKARDGLVIRGYLTLPVGRGGTDLPLIVMPHGGPSWRDVWGFSPEVQFFANRGYAVLQMNFRGSLGYGKQFFARGAKEWGRKMQDDITDGVKWAISEGIADPAHVGLFGASYGGYAVLMGLILTPEMYRCGISYAGVTDVAGLLRSSRRRGSKAEQIFVTETIGNYREEREKLAAVSPIEQVDKIRAPVFLAYGAKDPRVDVEQGKRLARALKKAGKQYEMVLEPEEGHGFLNETNRINLFRKIDRFLKTHL